MSCKGASASEAHRINANHPQPTSEAKHFVRYHKPLLSRCHLIWGYPASVRVANSREVALHRTARLPVTVAVDAAADLAPQWTVPPLQSLAAAACACATRASQVTLMN